MLLPYALFLWYLYGLARSLNDLGNLQAIAKCKHRVSCMFCFIYFLYIRILSTNWSFGGHCPLFNILKVFCVVSGFHIYRQHPTDKPSVIFTRPHWFFGFTCKSPHCLLPSALLHRDLNWIFAKGVAAFESLFSKGMNDRCSRQASWVNLFKACNNYLPLAYAINLDLASIQLLLNAACHQGLLLRRISSQSRA